jgi:putative photosynthetic complex assembly protein
MIIAAIVRTYEEDEFAVHKLPLMMMGGLVAFSLALTAGVSFGFFDRQAVPSEARVAEGAQVVASRTIRFVDEADGNVRVEDGATGEVLVRYGPGTGGFIRATARSLVHQREIRGIGPAVPFDLIEWDKGELTLQDPTTGKTVELASFGTNNRKVYAAMLSGKAK